MIVYVSRNPVYLRVDEGEVDPSVVEDAPVAVADVVEGGDELREERGLDGHVARRPGPLQQRRRPHHRQRSQLVRARSVEVLQSGERALGTSYALE